MPDLVPDRGATRREAGHGRAASGGLRGQPGQGPRVTRAAGSFRSPATALLLRLLLGPGPPGRGRGPTAPGLPGRSGRGGDLRRGEFAEGQVELPAVDVDPGHG